MVQKKLPYVMPRRDGVPGLGGAGGCAGFGQGRRVGDGFLLHFGWVEWLWLIIRRSEKKKI